MKKVLALVLAFAMILGSFTFAFATKFPDVSDQEVYSEAINVLSGLGVIDGYPNGEFRPHNIVTRAEMCAMLVKCLGMPVQTGSVNKFSTTDVPESHWASGYVALAESVGFIAGYPDGYFRPDQQVSYNEALTMIVSALGYTAESLTGTYPGAYVSKARGVGALETCKKTGTMGADRADIACFVYDTLMARIGTVNKDNEFVPNVVSYDKATDSYVYDTFMYRLGATDYNYGEAFVVTGGEDALINLNNYLGAYITAYQNKNEEIIAIKEVKSEWLEGDYDDLVDDGYKFDTAKKLGDEDGHKAENGEYVSFMNGDVDGAKDYKTDGVKLAVKKSGKTVKVVYSMQTWESEGEFMAKDDVQDEIKEDQTLDGGQYDFALDDNDAIDASTFAIFGKDAISEIAEDDVVTVYMHRFGENKDKIAKLEISDKTVVGEVTKINVNKKDAYTKWVIGGTGYAMSDYADADTKALAVEDKGTAYLNYNDEIHYFEPEDDTNTNYAVLLESGKETDKYGIETLYAKLFLADGTTKEFVVKNADVTSKAGISATEKGILVKYTVNSSDKITGFEKAKAISGTKIDANGVIGGKAIKASTAVFSFTGEAKDLNDADYYEVIKPETLFDSTVITISGNDDKGTLKAALVTGVEAAKADYALFISKNAEVKDGNFLWTALYMGAEKELTLDKDFKPSVATSASAILYKLVIDSSDIVTDASGMATVYVVTPITPTKSTSVSGSVFTAEDTNYSIDPDIAVYVYDVSDDEWTAKKASALAGRASAFEKITLCKSSMDGDFDYAIVIKK